MTTDNQGNKEENELERLSGEFAEAFRKNPTLADAARSLQESVFAAAEKQGVNAALAYSIIFRDLIMLEHFAKRVADVKENLTAGELPSFILEEAK